MSGEFSASVSKRAPSSNQMTLIESSNEDMSSLRYHKAIVINPGTNVETVKKNDVIFFDKAAGHSMVIDDSTYTVIEERDVVVVL